MLLGNFNKCNDWIISEWSECSRTCGTGFQTREAYCEHSNTDLCDIQRYPILRRACFLNPCYDWFIASSWSEVLFNYF